MIQSDVSVCSLSLSDKSASLWALFNHPKSNEVDWFISDSGLIT
jgi:hypothetical protein